MSSAVSFREYELNEALFSSAGILLGARLLFAGLVRAGVNVSKMLAPFPIGGIKGAVGGTVIGSIAYKYDLTAIIKTQSAGTQLVMDIASAAGTKISADLAASIFTKAMIGGGVTLGAIILTLVIPKSRRKVLKFFKGKGKKKNLTKKDITVIGKMIRNKKT